MTAEEACVFINDQLRIAAAVTVRGDAVKCYVPEVDGPSVDKTYLSADDCQALADAFGFLALGLAAPSGCPAKGGA